MSTVRSSLRQLLYPVTSWGRISRNFAILLPALVGSIAIAGLRGEICATFGIVAACAVVWLYD